MRKELKITEGIFPMPVLMVATYNEDGTVNVMNAAWGTMQERDTVALNLTESHKRVADLPSALPMPPTLWRLTTLALFPVTVFRINWVRRVSPQQKRRR